VAIIYKVKVKLSLCLTKHHTMKTYWRSWGIAPRILDIGTRWRWVVSFTSRLLYYLIPPRRCVVIAWCIKRLPSNETKGGDSFLRNENRLGRLETRQRPQNKRILHIRLCNVVTCTTISFCNNTNACYKWTTRPIRYAKSKVAALNEI